jgi:pimeloyl-ACP methyl ester carboxylesterase
VALVKALRPRLPTVLANPAGRTALLAQLSARPWALAAKTVLPNVLGPADAPGTSSALDALIRGPKQEGTANATASRRITIGWGRRGLVRLSRQAARAVAAFPGAQLHWFEHCGHFPQWDVPEETVRLILAGTSG